MERTMPLGNEEEPGNAGETESGKMICVGVITGAHGVRGHVRIKSFTAEPEDVAAYGVLYDDSGGAPLRLTVTGRSGIQLVARVDGVDDRNAAEALKGNKLFVPRNVLPPPDTDEFYHADLIGMRAELADGEHQREIIGAVVGVHDFGGGDVIEVETERGATIMVPFTRDAVPEVHVAEGRLVIMRLPGLLEAESAACEIEDARNACPELSLEKLASQELSS
jgi:16S rRNA processing protein RimM